jgi:hypothetical protein
LFPEGVTQLPYDSSNRRFLRAGFAANELHLGAVRNHACILGRSNVRRIVFCLSLLVLASACETTTDSIFGVPGGSGAVSQSQAAGNWVFTLQRTSTLACNGGLANGQLVTAHLDVGADGTVNTGTSTWQNPPTTLVRPISGTIRFTDGFTDLFLSSSSGSASAMELRGTMSSSATFSGTLTDPAPGSSPIFGTSGCEYTASGTKG